MPAPSGWPQLRGSGAVEGGRGVARKAYTQTKKELF